MKRLRTTCVLGLVLTMLVIAGCEDTEPSDEQRQVIESAVRGYLHALAEAYSTLDVSVLEEHASPNEVEAVHKLLKELVQTTGSRLDAELIGFEVETMSVFRGINATVRLLEVWNITRYGAADGIEKGRFESTIQRTLLQLRKVEGRWIIVGRSNLEQATPVPEEAEAPGGEGA